MDYPPKKAYVIVMMQGIPSFVAFFQFLSLLFVWQLLNIVYHIILWYCFNRLIKPDTLKCILLFSCAIILLWRRLYFFIFYIIYENKISQVKQKTFR